MGRMSELNMISREQGKREAHADIVRDLTRHGTPYHEAVRIADEQFPKAEIEADERQRQERERSRYW